MIDFKACISLATWGVSENECPVSAINMTIDLDSLGFKPSRIEAGENIILLDWKKGLQETIGFSVDPLFEFTCNGRNKIEVTLYCTKSLSHSGIIVISNDTEVNKEFTGGIPLYSALLLLEKHGEEFPFHSDVQNGFAQVHCEYPYEVIKQVMKDGRFSEERLPPIQTVEFDESVDFLNDYIGYSFNTEVAGVDFEYKLVCMGDFAGRDSRFYVDSKTLRIEHPKTKYNPLFRVGVFSEESSKRAKRIVSMLNINHIKIEK